MPEGDTIFRAARTLHSALAGKRVTRFETVLAKLASVDDQQRIAGRTIERVIASGKNLIIDFSGGLHLRTHMRMHGSWHIYRSGERWRRPHDEMRIVIGTEDFVAVGFSIPVAEFHDTRGLERQDDLRRIGPDLLREDFDVDDAMRRVRTRADAEIANALLNQRVVAGVGNIYKSESLFLSGIDPFAKVSEVSDADLKRLLNIARKVLRSRVRTDAREYDPWVYMRGGKPCRRCGTKIKTKKQGVHARTTYWCPKCQPPPSS